MPVRVDAELGESGRIDHSRRDFLFRCCQGAAAAFVPAQLRSLFFPVTDDLDSPGMLVGAGDFHLHPHYRTPRPLDALLVKTQAGLDDFVTEKYADDIAAILVSWSTSLQLSPQDMQGIERVLAPNFSGTPLRPLESRVVRSAPPVEVRQNTFAQQTSIAKDVFLQALQSSLGPFSKILTAEFQVTSIDAGSVSSSPSQISGQLQTRVRYQLVGLGKNLYREQRVGYWELAWEMPSAGGFSLRSWKALGETQSRSTSLIYLDITSAALAGNASYSSQLLHGTDYWRTVLDGACGIDIYGHNGVSVGDIDGDGFDDLYICQPGGLPNRLYRNRGDGTFQDITESSGVGVLDNTACALFVDVDNDGLQDLIVVRASGPLLFVNEGKGKFRQKSDAFQFATPPQGTFTGAAVADYDRDGWLDIYFCLYVYYQGTDQYKYPSPYYDANNGPPNFMMRNHRDGTFRDVTRETGLDKNNTRYSFCCGWTDINGDGWPDLYVVNDFGRKNLYRNNGDGTFTDIAAQAGVEDIGAGMSVCCFDYDNDGAQDLYVANMWTAGGERVAEQRIFKPDASKEVRQLFYKHAMGNSLLRNHLETPALSSVTSVPSVVKGVLSTTENTEEHGGNPTFENTTHKSGVGMGRWAWSSDAWDFDHDGFPDLYIANGMVSGPSSKDLNSFFWRQVVANSPDEAKPSHAYEQGWNAINELIRADGTWSGYERNVFYANNGDGTFSDISGAIGLDFIEDGRSFAIADFDNDGRQEVFLKNRNGPQLRILKNVIEELPPSIAFRLRGTKSNRDAIGAAVTVETERGHQTRMLQAGSGFLSQHSKEVFFGLGAAKGKVQATIRWPSGSVQEVHDLLPNHRVWIEEGSAPTRIEEFKSRVTKSQELKPASVRTGSGPAEAVTFHALAQEVLGIERVEQRLSAALRPALFASALAAEVSTSDDPDRLPSTIQTWLLAPVAAPDFSLPDQNRKLRTLSELRGKVVLLNFWTSQSPRSHELLIEFERANPRWSKQGLQLLTISVQQASDAALVSVAVPGQPFTFPILAASEDTAAIYNILYRYLFDRHRDLPLPTSFLIDAAGDVVKLYQGPIDTAQIDRDLTQIPRTAVERLKLALPFPGITEVTDFSRNYLAYGSIFFQRGYYDQAGAAFARALGDHPESAEALYGLGSVYLNQQKLAEARESFERAVKLSATYPDTFPNAWNNLGLLDARAGHTDAAITYFLQALRLSPDHVVALVNLGSAYRQLKHWGEARQAFNHALAISPADPEANYGLAMVYAQTAVSKDDNALAEQHLLRALESRPAYPEALNNLGILYLRTQRRDQAVARFQECIRVAPAFDQSYLNLARVYVVEGATDKAKVVLEELLKEKPKNAEGRKMMDQLAR